MTLAILVDLAAALGVHPRVMFNEGEMKPAQPGRPPRGGQVRTLCATALRQPAAGHQEDSAGRTWQVIYCGRKLVGHL
jgi:hypothetical protein